MLNLQIGTKLCKFAAMQRLGIGVVGIIWCVLIATPAAGQTMKPGLWEIASRVGGSGEMGAKMAAAQAQMRQQLAEMPPAQRKQMEQMLAQQGMNMGTGAGSGITTRICISKEMAARNQPPTQQQGNCKQEYTQRNGNTTRFKFTCANPPSSGTGEVTLHSAESYSMKMTTTSQTKGGPEQMSMDAQGKWLSNDCGNIKPVKG
jgi:Protein of unknown function (DUF3617)